MSKKSIPDEIRTFAIFRYSRERYDPEEWMFPGAGHIDGTVAGGMRAGLGAYPA